MNDRSPETAADRRGGRAELLVMIPLRDWSCAECGESGDFMFLEDSEPHCLDCADLGHLVFLPSGDAALTRRAKKASGLSAVVVRWARARKRYERQGILVEEEALAQAEEQCLADAVARERRRERERERRGREDVAFRSDFAAAIVHLFPRCPANRAAAIANHAGARGSGRIGRTAAGRRLDDEAVTLAVRASIRHRDTRYDELLMTGVSRAEARELVAADIDRVLRTWTLG